MDPTSSVQIRCAATAALAGIRRRPACATTVWIALVVGLAMARQGGIVFDDPFILFRYAENLATGHGWTFNPLEPSENAVTSPLYVVVLAALRLVGLHVPATATLLFFTMIVTCATMTAATLRSMDRPIAAIAAATLIATSPTLLPLWGMESALLLALLAAMLYLVVTRRPLWIVGIVWATMTLTRPEGLVLGGIVILVLVVLDRSRRPSIAEYAGLVLTATVPLVLWIVVARLGFGDPLPSTLAAKIAQAESGQWPVYFSIDGLREVGYPTRPATSALYAHSTLALGLVAIGGAVFGRVDRRLVTVLVSFILALAVGQGLVLGIASYPWYYAVPVFASLVLAGLGIEILLTSIGSRVSTVRMAAVTGAVVAGLVVTIVLLGVERIPSDPAAERADYEYIGTWLRFNTAEDASVASMEIGTIGWYSDRTMVDYLGLLDGGQRDHIADGDFTRWPAELQPDYWVTSRTFVDVAVVDDPCIMRHFDVNASSPTLVVLHRNSPIPPGRCPSRGAGPGD